MFDKISTALFNLLKGPTPNTLVQSSYQFEASSIEGFPALTLTPAANESAYSTTTENRRVYAFMVRLYVERPSGNANEEACENTMRELVDTVLDTVDKNHMTLGQSVAAQTGYTYLFMHAAPSQWGYAGAANALRVAEILVRVEMDIDVNLIT